MTAVALKTFDQPRTQRPREHASPEHRNFAKLVDKATKEPKPVSDRPDDTAKQLLKDNGPSQNEALLALIENIPAGEMPHGGVPEAIATDVSVVVELPHDAPKPATNVALASSIVDLLPALPVQAQGTVELPIEEEISDGIPIAIESGPRPKWRRPVDEDAVTTAIPVLPELQLGRARTELALPIVDGKGANKITQIIPQAIPVLPELAAKLAPMSPPVAELPLTPLEQAVQDLIGELDDRDDKKPEAVASATPYLPEVKLLSIEHADAPPPVSAIREPQNLVENSNPSHVHLVIDDGAERVVVTVAVRGTEVNVALRGQDDATTAALARNAGSLDHAMRARGLDLAGLMTGREPESQKQRPDREQRDRNPKDKFSIEELA